MDAITSKAEVQRLVAAALQAFHAKGMDAAVDSVHKHILSKKIRFPLLETAAKELYKSLPEQQHIQFLDKVTALHTIGGNVLAGMILQLRLGKHFKESFSKAIEYIIAGNEWYVCDIIGERVMGHALLTMPEEALPALRKLAKHEDKWIVRSVGVAGHYAVKKGLKKQYADEMFCLLLSLCTTTEFHTKKGVGWAAKTIAKFHPDIIEKYNSEIYDNEEVKQWFKTKIKIGLGRTWKYAHRYTG